VVELARPLLLPLVQVPATLSPGPSLKVLGL
jgi:hypothetical protein